MGRGAGYRLAWFALLKGHRAPDNLQFFRAQLPDDVSIDFTFEAIQHIPAAKGSLGIIRPDSSFNKLKPGCYHVVKSRKRRSGVQDLLVVGSAPADFAMQGPVRQRGFAKAVGRAHEQIATPTIDDVTHLWLAVELAQRGFIDRSLACNLIDGTCLPVPQKLPACTTLDGLLAWNEYLERQVDALEQTLGKLTARNPLLDRVSLRQVCRWLSISNETVASEVLRRFAKQHKLKAADSPLGNASMLGPTLTAKLSDQAAAVRDELMARMERGEGAGRRGLHELYPSNINIVEHLFNAEHLYEGPDGYVFTRGELERYMSALAARHANLGEVSVKEIKTELGLQRRPAEGLRAFLSGLVPAADEESMLSESGGA